MTQQEFSNNKYYISAFRYNIDYKKEQKTERERERVLTVFLWGKYRLSGRNYINLYKIKWGEEESKYKKEKIIKEV